MYNIKISDDFTTKYSFSLEKELNIVSSLLKQCIQGGVNNYQIVVKEL